MPSERRASLYCETLTVRTLFGVVLPHLFGNRSTQLTCWYVDATSAAAALGRLFGRLIGVGVERLDFRLVDVRDSEGRLVRLRVAFEDIEDVQSRAVEQPQFQAFCETAGLDVSQREYLAKCVGMVSLTERATLWRALLLVQVAAWHAERAGAEVEALLLERRPWQEVITAYAARYRVTVVPYRAAFRVGQLIRDRLGPRGMARFRRWRDVVGHVRFVRSQGAPLMPVLRRTMTPPVKMTETPSLLVEVSHFNVASPGQHSDLFFWQESSFDASSLVLTFGVPSEPLTEERQAQLQSHGIRAVSVYPGAATVAAPIFTHAPKGRSRRVPRPWSGEAAASDEWRWMETRLEHYDVVRGYWDELFAMSNAMAYVTWYRFDERIYPIADAMRSRGGVTAVYQRSFEIDPSPEMAARVDLMFSFSPMVADVEERSGSVIDYHVAVGYLGDHRARHQRDAAAKIRRTLESKGARRVFAYFDENSADDSRWHTGHEFMRANYQSVLERLLREPALGLVLKPKHPSSLRRRLGPLAPLLEEALATGRCYLCDAGTMHGSDPPVLAALAADLVIHGHLCGATAGLEAALAGVPTLLLDREGWPASPMYELGVGKVVFRSWDDVWSAVDDHFSTPGGIKGFGRWESLLDCYDPFRDGRAAQRMGEYLAAVMAGLRAGRGRRGSLADAADQYAAKWGADKIARVGGRTASAPSLSVNS